MTRPTNTLAALLSLSLCLASIASSAEDSVELENDKLRIRVAPQTGMLEVTDRRAFYTWRQPAAFAPSTDTPTEPRFRNVERIETPHPGIRFEGDFGNTDGNPNTLHVSLYLPEDKAELIVEADMPNRQSAIKPIPFFDSFALDTKRAVLAVADYCNGHLYPLDGRPLPKTYFSADRLDMPWLGVCDLERTFGYLMIIDTSDDAGVGLATREVDGRTFTAPRIDWRPSKGAFAYPRRLIYRFVANGGYVVLAKEYREYAQQQGLIVPFSQKLKQNPNIERLFGAPNVWGSANLNFARQAKVAGVEKMLIQGRCSPKELKAINELGYLTSEYDNYCDILPVEQGKEPDKNHDYLPDAAVLKADGERMTAWITFDKKLQYMKRSPALWKRTAQLDVPKVLAEYPFLGRFIDVTTAESLYEDYDPNHPLTKGDKRRCGQELLAYVRSLGLVMGGEHGIWWAVPHLDFIEGMMSGGSYSWPAGHLIRPKSKDDEFTGPWGGKSSPWEAYEQWGIGHEWRAPLWELVFHDCVVSTWYWGDSSDYLLDAAPEITPKKDAFNILYGTTPMMWGTNEGSWQKDREVFLRTYRNTCKLHEAIADKEMLTHEFLTPDHAAQRTRFSDGTEVVVNFGEAPYTATVDGKTHVLPQNGFAVKGPQIEQSLEVMAKKTWTTVRTKGYLHREMEGMGQTLRLVDNEVIRGELTFPNSPKHIPPFFVDPTALSPDWDVAGTRAFALDETGARKRQLTCAPNPKFGLVVGRTDGVKRCELVCGAAASRPDLCFRADDPVLSETHLKQGEPLTLEVGVANRGGSAAEGVVVGVYVDEVTADRCIATRTVSPAPGQEHVLTFAVDSTLLDGNRNLVVAADTSEAIDELCERNNTARRPVYVSANMAHWTHRRPVDVSAAGLWREDSPVELEMELPNVKPDSVRVVHSRLKRAPSGYATPVPAQFEPSGQSTGTLCFLLHGMMHPNQTRHFFVLWSEKGEADSPPSFAHRGAMWDPTTARITATTYTARFENGVLRDLAVQDDGEYGEPFLDSLVFSSKETGWVEESGSVEAFEVRANGPAKTEILVRKAMDAGVVYEKTYSFYPRFFDVAVTVNKPSGAIYSRAYYRREGTYEDDQGFTATVDGQGDAENIHGKAQSPKWFTVSAEDWAHACLALTPCGYICYWDSSAWGGIGFGNPEDLPVRMRYYVNTGSEDATWAATAYDRVITPVQIRVD